MGVKEETIFSRSGSKIITDDREIDILVRFEEPLIMVLGNVLSEEECIELIQLSKDRLNRSKIGTSHEINDTRTSSGAFLREGENNLVGAIEKRVAQIMNVPLEHGESLHILHYEVGQEYQPHFDFFSNESVINNRISTLVIYLNDVESGGATTFPKLNLSVYPRRGNAVYFEYFYNDSALNDLTFHAGTPVMLGDKWIATQWMRRQKYRE